LFNPETATAGVIVGLTSPIFDGGRIRANIEAKNAAEEQAMNAYETSVLQALSDVEDALIACRRSGERLATLETAVVSAREAATLANQRYRAGVADLITVLDAQRAELSVEEGLVSARADRSTAYVQLYKALGGGWSQGS
jgi:outer membrane protein TolC